MNCTAMSGISSKPTITAISTHIAGGTITITAITATATIASCIGEEKAII